MLETLLKNQFISNYLQPFPKIQWRRWIQATLLVGIRSLNKSGKSQITIDELENMVGQTASCDSYRRIQTPQGRTQTPSGSQTNRTRRSWGGNPLMSTRKSQSRSRSATPRKKRAGGSSGILKTGRSNRSNRSLSRSRSASPRKRRPLANSGILKSGRQMSRSRSASPRKKVTTPRKVSTPRRHKALTMVQRTINRVQKMVSQVNNYVPPSENVPRSTKSSQMRKSVPSPSVSSMGLSIKTPVHNLIPPTRNNSATVSHRMLPPRPYEVGRTSTAPNTERGGYPQYESEISVKKFSYPRIPNLELSEKFQRPQYEEDYETMQTEEKENVENSENSPVNRPRSQYYAPNMMPKDRRSDAISSMPVTTIGSVDIDGEPELGLFMNSPSISDDTPSPRMSWQFNN